MTAVSDRGASAFRIWKDFFFTGVRPPDGLLDGLDGIERSPEGLACLDWLDTDMEEPPAHARGARVRVYCGRRSDLFVREQRDALALALLRIGATAMVGAEADYPPEPGWRAVVFAPHDFFLADERLRGLCQGGGAPPPLCVNTAPLASGWFIPALAHCLEHTACFLQADLPTAVAARRLGYACHYFPPAMPPPPSRRFESRPGDPIWLEPEVRDFQAPPGDPLAARPLDLAGFGTGDSSLDEKLARLAPALARRTCFLSHTSNISPVAPEAPLRGVGLARRAKVVLSLGPGRGPLARTPLASWPAWLGGALLLGDGGCGVPGLEEGKHYLRRPPEGIPTELDRILDTEEGLREAQAMRNAARSALDGLYPPAKLAGGVLRLLEGM